MCIRDSTHTHYLGGGKKRKKKRTSSAIRECIDVIVVYAESMPGNEAIYMYI